MVCLTVIFAGNTGSVVNMEKENASAAFYSLQMRFNRGL